MKHLPNDISAFRIAGSIGLLFCDVTGWPFWMLYALCGISDMVDGWLARKLHAETKAGAILDSVADIVLVACCAIRLLPVLEILTWLWIWAGVIAFIKMVNQVSALVVCKRFCFHRRGFCHVCRHAGGTFYQNEAIFLTFLLTRTLRHILSLPPDNKSAQLLWVKTS